MANAKDTETDEIKPQTGRVGDGAVTPSAIKEYYSTTEGKKNVNGTYTGLNYEDVAEHFNVRVYDVRKVLDPDFGLDPDVEAGIKEAD